MTARTGPGHLWQGGRVLPALDPASFPIDGRSPARRIAWAAGFSRLLTYFAPDGTRHPAPGPGETGAWERIFRADATFLLAEMAVYDAEAEARTRRGAGRNQVEMAARAAYRRLALWTDEALGLEIRVPSGPIETALADTLRAAAGTQLRQVVPRGYRAGLRPLSPPAETLLHQTDAGVDAYRFGTDRDEPELVFEAINRALAQVSDTARRLLTASLRDNQRHPAQTTLFLTFLSMHEAARADLDRLTGRHLAFYYRDVLRLAPRNARPDHVDLWIQTVPGAFAEGPGLVPAGTALVAKGGSPAQPVLFSTDRDLILGPATIAAARALRVTRAPNRDGRRGAVEAVEAFRLPPGSGAAGTPPAKGWPLFGSDARAPSAADGAALGFALCAPILAMAEGARRIVATLSLTSVPGHDLAAAMAALADGRAPDGSGTERLSDDLVVELSGPDGWVRCPAEVELRPGADAAAASCLVIRVALDAEAPPVVAPVSGAEARAGAPILRVTLDPAARRYLYPLLSGLRVAGAKIATDVAGVRRLALFGSGGPIDPAKPFAPFGPAPQPGAALVLASAELWNKALSRLDLRLTWSGLPPPPQTLAGYYADYDLGLATDSFRVTLSAGRASGWQPVPATGTAARGEAVLLFRERPDGQGMDEISTLVFDPGGLEPVRCAPPAAGQKLRVDPSEIDGVFRLTLAAPAAGFGDRAYAGLVASRAMQNARRVFWFGKIRPQPPPPLQPKVTSVALDYSAHVQTAAPLADAALRLWRVDPLGPMRPAQSPRLVTPELRDDGWLCLGLSGATPGGKLSLLVDLSDSALADRLPAAAGEAGAITWRYFGAAGWTVLPGEALVRDGTDGLAGSGVIEISLPADLATTDRLEPPGLCWLSVAARGDLRRFGRVRALHTNAVGATRRMPAGAEGGAAPALAAGQITRSQTAVPGIARIHQPAASRGGRAAENLQDFRVRVSERLRHRARAIAPHDYAALVLEAHPELSDAVCLRAAPGCIDIVVAPVRRTTGAALRPAVPFAERERIAGWLARRAGVAVQRVRVRNPSYETIQVRAQVVAAPGIGALIVERLEEALDRLIAPWLFDPAAPVPIGTGMLAPDLVAARMERRDDVVRLGGLSLVQVYGSLAGSGLGPGADGQVIYGLKDTARDFGHSEGRGAGLGTGPGGAPVLHPSTPWSVLVPAAAHRLEMVPGRAGLGGLVTGIDLGVTPADLRPLYRAQPQNMPMRPSPAGIGTLAVGRDLVVESAAAARAPSGPAEGLAADSEDHDILFSAPRPPGPEDPSTKEVPRQ